MRIPVYRTDMLIKYVRVARMWCRTSWDDRGHQQQEWSLEKPNETIKKT